MSTISTTRRLLSGFYIAHKTLGVPNLVAKQLGTHSPCLIRWLTLAGHQLRNICMPLASSFWHFVVLLSNTSLSPKSTITFLTLLWAFKRNIIAIITSLRTGKQNKSYS